MTINQCALGCGLVRPGEGAAAQFPRGKIYNIRWGGGDVIAFIFRPGGLNQTIRPVASADNMTINQCAPGFGLKQPGDGMAARFVMCIFSELWPAWGFKASLNCDRVDKFDQSARSLASKT